MNTSLAAAILSFKSDERDEISLFLPFWYRAEEQGFLLFFHPRTGVRNELY